MSELDIISIIGGLLLVVLVFIVEAYWADAGEYMYKASDTSLPHKERVRAVDNYARSLTMFKRGSLFMFVLLLTTILPIYFPQYLTIAKSLLGATTLFILVFLVLMANGKFFTKLPTPIELMRNLALGDDDHDT